MTVDERPQEHTDRERFWELWLGCEDRIKRLSAAWLGGNEMDGDDIASATLLRACHAFDHQHPQIKDFTAWVTTIARNVAMDHHRDRRRTVPLPTDESLLSAPRTRFRDVLEDVSTNEEAALVRRQLSALPVTLSKAADLFFHEGLSHRDIASRLSISEPAARKRIQLARQQIRHGCNGRSEAVDAPSVQADASAADEPQTTGCSLARVHLMPTDCGRISMVITAHPIPGKRLEQRISSLRKYLDQHPRGWRRHFELAIALFANGEYAEATRLFSMLAARGREDPRAIEAALALIQLSGLRARQAELEWAEDLAERSARHPRERALAKGWIAIHRRQAETAMAQAAAIRGHPAGIQLELAALVLRGDRDQSTRASIAAVEAQPQHHGILTWAARLLRPGDQASKSICERLLAIDPEHPVAICQHFAALLNHGAVRGRHAANQLKRALRAHPVCVPLTHIAAKVYHAAGRADLAWSTVADRCRAATRLSDSWRLMEFWARRYYRDNEALAAAIAAEGCAAQRVNPTSVSLPNDLEDDGAWWLPPQIQASCAERVSLS